MSILNEHLEWEQIKLDPRTTGSFRHDPKKTLLDPRQMLCRFITAESQAKNIPGNETFFSPRWMDWNTTASMLARWRTVSISPRDVVRARLAVTTTMSRCLDSLVQIILTKPVYAWKGIARYQDDNFRKVTYLAGGVQIYLPNLASDRLGLKSDVAYMHCFTSVESL